VQGQKGKEKTIKGVRGKKGQDQMPEEKCARRRSIEGILLKAAFILVLLAALFLFVMNNYFPAEADRLFGPM